LCPILVFYIYYSSSIYNSSHYNREKKKKGDYIIISIINLIPTDDAYISQLNPNTNFGSASALCTGTFFQTNDVYRSLLKFNVSGAVPSANCITNATLF
jgi:hypothetical protein